MRMWPTVLLLAWGVLGPGVVHADPVAFDKDGVTGTVDKKDDAMHAHAVVVINRPVETVLAALTDFGHLGDWLPETLEYRGESKGGLNGRFYRKSKAPPLLPDPYATCEATGERQPNGGAVVRWQRVEGSIKQFDARYQLDPVPGGTRVTYTVVTVPPFAIPGFVLKRVAPNAIADTLRGLRRHALAMPAPAPTSPLPVVAPAAAPDGGVSSANSSAGQ